MEALHDAVVRRVHWMTHPEQVFRDNCTLDDGQVTVNDLITAFFKTANHLRSMTELDKDFEDMTRIPDALMDLIVNIQVATTWEDVATHTPDGCELCVMFATA